MDIKKLISGIEDATGIKPSAFNTTSINNLPAINFQVYKQGDNGAVESWRFETRITADTLASALDIDDKMTDLLVSFGDGTYNGMYIEHNGGGTLLDPETDKPQIITYYDITNKSKRG